MKNFIINVNKNKKWITLGISILYLLLFCFPIKTLPHGENSIYKLPYIILLPKSIIELPQTFQALNLNTDKTVKSLISCSIATDIICALLMLATFATAIICLIYLFKNKRFLFIWSITLAFLTMLMQGVYFDVTTSKYALDLCPTFYIFLILLVLDIAYLILERHYLKTEPHDQ